jgi:hypothetical protein
MENLARRMEKCFAAMQQIAKTGILTGQGWSSICSMDWWTHQVVLHPPAQRDCPNSCSKAIDISSNTGTPAQALVGNFAMRPDGALWFGMTQIAPTIAP